jgi:hypothetical protein
VNDEEYGKEYQFTQAPNDCLAWHHVQCVNRATKEEVGSQVCLFSVGTKPFAGPCGSSVDANSKATSFIHSFPIVKHGFWHPLEGMRRTVVSIYNNSTWQLDRVCFLEQSRVHECADAPPFDVSAVNLDGIRVLTKELEMTLDELKQELESIQIELVETLNGMGMAREQREDDAGALARLVGTGDEDTNDSLRIILPNDIILKCPWTSWSRQSSTRYFHGIQTKMWPRSPSD